MVRRYLMVLFMLMLVPALALSAQQNGGTLNQGMGQGMQQGGSRGPGLNSEQVQERMKQRIGELEKRLNLTDAELQKVETAVSQYRDQIKEAMADIAVVRAQVSREMVNDHPDVDKIRTMVRKSLDLEVTVRMADIQRQIAIRDIIGQDRWVIVAQALKERLGAIVRNGEGRLLKLLEQIQERNN